MKAEYFAFLYSVCHWILIVYGIIILIDMMVVLFWYHEYKSMVKVKVKERPHMKEDVIE